MLRPLTFTRVVGNGSGLGNTSKEEVKRTVSTSDAVEVDDLIHSAINLDQRIVLEVELLRQSLGEIGPDSEKRFDDVIKYLIREAEILREARSHLDKSNKRLDALADKALQ
jgi:hypothetical protein